MHRKIAFPAIIIMLALLIVSMSPAIAWEYPDDSSDAKFESFGPRADALRIDLYADDTAEFAAIKRGELDITDWPLSKTEYVDMTTNYPGLKIVNYGPEFGLFILDMNSNDNQYLGNPPNSEYPNPVEDRDPGSGNPNIGGGAGSANDYNPMSSVELRRAIGHLTDRYFLIADPTIGAGFGYPMFTTMPPAMSKYLLPVEFREDMPWAWEYNRDKAAAQLEAGLFKINLGTGYRYWDRNDDGVEQADEYVELLFWIRSDHPGRKMIGTTLTFEMTTDPINLRVNAKYATSGTTFTNVMVNKDFHLYTGGWSLGVDPDHLILWAWDYYWHPGFSYNYGGHNCPGFNDAADGIMYANNQEEAVAYAYTAQYWQAYMVLGVPLYCVSGNKAMSRTYVGDTAAEQAAGYTGQNWLGVHNMMGYGIDNDVSFMNMHPEGYERGTGPMTIRYGFKVPDVKQLNPIYASWLFDWNVMDRIYYDTLLVRNASDLGEILPWLAEAFEVGTYLHPTLGICSKVKFTLRPDATWQDGTPLTVADVYFTYVELKNILIDRGLPYPWWWSQVQNILSFSILDPYNFEVLLDVKSYWALYWVSLTYILPKHIWKPIAETGDPQAYMPDPDLIGQGPWRFAEFPGAGTYVLLKANEPGSVVRGITSPYGYWRYSPYSYLATVDGDTLAKVDYYTQPHSISWTSTNTYLGGSLTYEVTSDVGTPYTITLGPGTSDTRGFDIPILGKLGIHCHYHITAGDFAGDEFDVMGVIYGTITEDIAGSTYYDDIDLPGYPYKSQLPSPDIKVDIKDIAIAAKAFGAYPGHERWSTIADITGDYKVDIRDIAGIAKQFGWTG